MSKKTILITSHWTPHALCRTFRAGLLQAVAEVMPDCNVIQTGHNQLWCERQQVAGGNFFDGAVLWQELKSIEQRYPHVRVIEAPNVLPLLNAADLFVGDMSSVLVEFACLDRPMLFFDNGKYVFHDKAVYAQYLAAAAPFRSIEEAVALCRVHLAQPDLHQAGRQQIVQHNLDHLGNAAQTAVDVLLALGRLCSPKSKRWQKAVALSEKMMQHPMQEND